MVCLMSWGHCERVSSQMMELSLVCIICHHFTANLCIFMDKAVDYVMLAVQAEFFFVVEPCRGEMNVCCDASLQQQHEVKPLHREE